MQSAPSPQSARIEELAPALRLVFQHLLPDDREHRVRNALHLIQTGDLDERGVFVLHEPSGALGGALICAPVPGGSGALWPPVVRPGPFRVEREDALVRHACAWLRSRGARVAQALLPPDEEAFSPPLERNGLARVTNLWYLRHNLALLAPPPLVPGLTFEAYDPAEPGPFHRALVRTYEDTLDCPEVTGARSTEEVIRGHQAQGLYDPDRWWLARVAAEAVGVLITIEGPESGEWEVAYMGIVPEARRRGLGKALLHKALSEARAADAPCVTLSVDARNEPAWQLYRNVGFQPFDRRAVYLTVWR